MKKYNKYQRRTRALARLSAQIKEHRLSIEFHNKIADLPQKEKDKQIISYWERKQKELDNLSAKITI